MFILSLKLECSHQITTDETVLAEKIETILSRLELNGRMRDLYDIYLIYTKDWSNTNLLREDY